jgi:hypothetical protein
VELFSRSIGEVRMKVMAGMFATITVLAIVSPARCAVLVPGNPLARNCYAIAEFQGDPITGVSLCNRALDDAMSLHDRAATFVNRRILLALLSDMNGAIADYGRAIDINSTLSEAYLDG